MDPIPVGLEKLLQYGHLSAVALTAAVDQPALREPVSRRRRLPGRVVERCFAAGVPPAGPVAEGLVGRRLPVRTVRWLLSGSGERRPEVLAAVLRHNVPGARERRRLLAHPDDRIIDAVLDNPDWPTDEQLAVAGRAHTSTVMRWLARLDPDVPLSPADLVGWVGPGRRLDVRLRDSPLSAMLQRPWLAELPASLLSEVVRCAVATVTSDERTLYALLGHAQRLGTAGRLREAGRVIEAVACNPAASLGVQRRCRRLARWIPCHYLEGWRPARAVDGPLWEADVAAQRRVMARLEELSAARHLTVWSAALLTANPDLADEVRDQLVTYLDEHLGPAIDSRSVDLLADRLGVPETTRARWQKACEYQYLCGTAAMRPYWDEGLHGGPAPAWEELELAGCAEAPSRRLAVRRLRAAFGTDEEAWSLAWLLLREGWAVPLAVLPSVVASLRVEENAA
jgi:hypothetical protein